MILAQAEAALTAAGFRWSAQETRLLGARWIGLERDGVAVDEVALALAGKLAAFPRGAWNFQPKARQPTSPHSAQAA